ncbi:hypothetical protein [Streptomyces sp. NBC_00356]|uniref:hypothetical protein n=1 Tax=Streptomyces sp. NBC_00356 TaxID=2975724 RepID=UPI003FA6C71A
MTEQSGQSGQGERPHLPQARQTHEGVVLPADGGEPLLPGTYGDQAGPAGASPWGQPWGPESQQAHNAGPMPTYDGSMPTYEWGQPQGAAAMPPAQQQDPHALPPQSYGAALPQQQPAQALPQQYAEAGPLPPAAPAGPAPGAYDGDATQYIPPAQQQATQYAAGPGLPPEAPAPDATQFLGRAQPMPDAAPPGYGGSPDSQATQYIPPVPGQPMPGQAMPPQGMPPQMPPQGMPAQDQGYGVRPGAPGERQPPAEFDALFRTEPESAAGATQQMPRFDPNAAPPGHGGPGTPGMTPPPQQYGYEPEPPRGGKTRTGSKVPLIAAVGVAILVVGVGAGAMLSGGDDDDKKTDATKNVSNSAPASESASPSVDPAKAQAVELDKLLGDSNNSRSAVVRSVANIGGCKALPQASKDLRSAANQRNDLVTRLGTLQVDQLPDHARLTAALTSAWKASASADAHYAKWGDQVAAKKHALCKKGHAKPTSERRAGDGASGTASTQKQQASKLWNQIASKYGLTQRSAVQL